MNLSLECTFDWLLIRFPHLPALCSGVLLGSFGLGSLSLMIWVLAPASLCTWMPMILFFCAANAGYKLMQKRNQDVHIRGTVSIIGLAGWFFLLATAILSSVHGSLFQTGPSGLTIVILAACAGAGTWTGQRLRLAYEKIDT
jgi:hypothetical protein